MSFDDVSLAQVALEKQHKPVSVAAIQAYLGRGSARTIRRHLARIRRQREAQARSGGLPPPQRRGPTPRGRHFLDGRYPTREAEMAALDAHIVRQREAGFGATPVVQPSAPVEEPDEERNQTRWERRQTHLLVCSLLEEAVPWLTTADLEDQP